MFAFDAAPVPPRVLRHRLSALILAAAFLLLASRSFAQQGPPNGLPVQAAARAQAQFEGELEVQYEDSDHGARLHHFLRTANGRRLRLEFGATPPGLATGHRIRATGTLDGEALTVAGTNGVQTLSLAAPNTFGEQRAIVILVNFQDNQSVPYTAAAAWTTTFDAASDFYLENSYGQTWLTGDVFGWFTLPMGSSVCDTNQISTLADQAATQAGANLGSYTRKIYAFPKIAACSWWGLGSVGGTPSRAWINGSYGVQVVAHELGHNLGNHHSHSQPCASGSCTSVEYGDNRDIMGNVAVAHTTAFQKERLGWLNYGASPPIQTVGQSNTYWVDGYSPAGTLPKALKILKGTDASGGKTWYYVEARVPFGEDARIAPGVLVHTGTDAVGSSSYQIDLDPVSSAFDSVLDVGQTFTDVASGLRVTTLSADSTGALVEVAFDAAPCVAAAPGLTMSPGTTVWTQPGVAARFTITLRNNDSAGCGASAFSLSSAVPAGWQAAFGSGSLTVEPGASASAALGVTPPAGASGQQSFTATASRGAAGTSATGTVGIATALTMTLSIGGSTKTGYPLAASVATGGQALANVTVTFTVSDAFGKNTVLSAVTNTSGVASVKWRPRKNDPAGTYQVRAAASSGGLSGSATGTLVR